MKKINFILGLVLMLMLGVTSVDAQYRFSGAYDEGEFNDVEEVFDLSGNSDGFISCGVRNGVPLVVRTAADGSVIWSESYSGVNDANAKSICISKDPISRAMDGYVVFCDNSIPTEFRTDVIKLDLLGNVLWSREIKGGNKAMAYKIEQDKFFDYVAFGSLGNDRVFLAKVSFDGSSCPFVKSFSEEFQRLFGNALCNNKNGYTFMGWKTTTGGVINYLIETDYNGNIVNQIDYLIRGFVPNEIAQTDDNQDGIKDDGYIVCGDYSCYSKHHGIAPVMKIGVDLEPQWMNDYYNQTPNLPRFLSVTEDNICESEQSFVVCGQSYYGSGDHTFGMRLDNIGGVIQAKTFRRAQVYSRFNSVKATADRGLVFAGTHRNNTGYFANILKQIIYLLRVAGRMISILQ